MHCRYCLVAFPAGALYMRPRLSGGSGAMGACLAPSPPSEASAVWSGSWFTAPSTPGRAFRWHGSVGASVGSTPPGPTVSLASSSPSSALPEQLSWPLPSSSDGYSCTSCCGPFVRSVGGSLATCAPGCWVSYISSEAGVAGPAPPLPSDVPSWCRAPLGRLPLTVCVQSNADGKPIST